MNQIENKERVGWNKKLNNGYKRGIQQKEFNRNTEKRNPTNWNFRNEKLVSPNKKTQ